MRWSKLLILILVGTIVGSPVFYVKSADDWSMYRHDPARTAYSESKAPDTNTIRWILKYGDFPGVVADGKLFTAMFCFNASTSEFIRQNRTLTSDINTITVLEGKGYSVQVQDIVCWNVTNGVEIWRYESNKRITSSPLIVGNRLYVVLEDNWFYCLNATTGKEIWKFETEYFYCALTPAYLDGKIYIGFYGGYSEHFFGGIICLNALSGNFLWNFSTSNSHFTYSTPTIYKDKVFFNMWLDKLYGIDNINGNKIWEYYLNGSYITSLAVYDDKLYFGSSDKNVYCLNANTGSIIWKYTTGDEIHSSPAIADGKIFIASNDNIFYCLDADSGERIWTHKLLYPSGYFRSSPIIANGNVYIKFLDGWIILFWSFT